MTGLIFEHDSCDKNIEPLLSRAAPSVRDQAARFAGGFAAEGAPGDYIVLCGIDPVTAQAAVLGAWWSGRPVAILDPALRSDLMAQAFKQIGPALRLTAHPSNALSGDYAWLDAQDYAAAAPPATPAPPVSVPWPETSCALALFTSGSTGSPKGVCHSLGNVLRSAYTFIEQFRVTDSDHFLNLAPLHTISGFRGSVLVPLLSDCRLVPAPANPGLVDVLKVLQRYRPTLMVSGPALIKHLQKLTGKINELVKPLRAILCTGAPLDHHARQTLWEAYRLPVLIYYGLTETTGLAAAESLDDYDPGATTVGSALPGVRLTLVPVDGVKKGGQLRIASPNLFLGYLGESLRRREYLDSRDLARIDSRANIELLGRLDRGVKAATTEWLFPEVLERYLISHPDVIDAQAMAGYDAYGCGVFDIEVVLRNSDLPENHTLEKLADQIERDLGKAYRPASSRCVTTLERSVLGKLVKGQSK